MDRIPVCDLKKQYQSLKPEIDEAIHRVLNNGKFILGDEVRAFELEMAAYLKVFDTVGVASGTDALLLAIKSIHEEYFYNDVITTPLTFTATSEAIMNSQCLPYFVDIDSSMNIDTDKIDIKKLDGYIGTDNIDIIIPVHLYGKPCDMNKIIKLAQKYNLKIIEDCAQSIGAMYEGKKVGTIGDIGCFSFYPSKILGCYGDGGLIASNDKEIIKKARMLRDHGRHHKYNHEIVGHNSRLDEIQAAILRVKLKHLDEWIERRRLLFARYLFELDGLKEFIEIPLPSKGHVFNYYTIRVKNAQRQKLMIYLEKKGIDTVICYPAPLHLLPAYSFVGHTEGDFPEAEKACNEVLSLPMYPELEESKVDYICEMIRRFYEK